MVMLYSAVSHGLANFIYNIRAYGPLSVVVSPEVIAEQVLPDLSSNYDFPTISSFVESLLSVSVVL
jgi:hypothetical protein